MPPSARCERTRYLPSMTRPTRESATLDVTAGVYGAPPPIPRRRPASESGVDRLHAGDIGLRVGEEASRAHGVEALVVGGDGLVRGFGHVTQGAQHEHSRRDVVAHVVEVELAPGEL